MERHLICEFVFDSWFQQHLLLVLIHQPKLLKEAWCTNRQPHPVCPPVALKGSASNKRRPWELSTSPPPTPFWTESKFRPILDGIEQNRFWELDPLMRSMWCSLIKWVFVKKKANSPWENHYPKAYLASLWKLKLHGRIFRKGPQSHGRRARGERSQGMMESSPSLKSGAVARQEPKHADGGGTAVGTGGRWRAWGPGGRERASRGRRGWDEKGRAVTQEACWGGRHQGGCVAEKRADKLKIRLIQRYTSPYLKQTASGKLLYARELSPVLCDNLEG